MTHPRFRTPLAMSAILALTAGAAVAATATANAATKQRMAVSTSSGSLGATTFLQSSASGSALQGEVAGSAQTAIKIPFGVLGEYDAAGTTFGIGVIGISTTGYGVGAEVFGNNPAIVAESQGTGAGIEAIGMHYDAMEAFVDADHASAIYAEDDSPDHDSYGVLASTGGVDAAAVVGFNLNGAGGVFESEGAAAGDPALQVQSYTPGTELFDAQVQGSNFDNYEVSAMKYPSGDASGSVQNTSDGGNADFQLNGDIMITGTIYTQCPNAPLETAPNQECTSTIDSASAASNGAMVRAYGSRNAAPTMEDAGETRMVNGYAHVTLDPTFAAAISTKQPYLVFPAPQGDSRGVYVTNRTPAGFDVRENAGGKTNMTIDYRIVAKPFASESKRMAFVTPHRNVRTGLLSKRIASRMTRIRSTIAARHAQAKPKDFASFTTR